MRRTSGAAARSIQVGVDSRGGRWPPIADTRRTSSASVVISPPRTYASPIRPRSPTSAMPAAMSSTCAMFNPASPKVSARRRPGRGLRQHPAERRVVAGPVHAARHRDQHRRPGGDPLVRGEVRAMLRLVVEADVPIRPRPLVRLVDDPVARVAEGVDRRDVDDAARRRPPLPRRARRSVAVTLAASIAGRSEARMPTR